jgi:hypothetical protein
MSKRSKYILESLAGVVGKLESGQGAADPFVSLTSGEPIGQAFNASGFVVHLVDVAVAIARLEVNVSNLGFTVDISLCGST